MKQRIDLEKAAEAEAFGALAVGVRRKHRGSGATGKPFTPAQSRALSDMARSLVQIARDAGAARGRVVASGVSFELRENGAEEVLSIRTGRVPDASNFFYVASVTRSEVRTPVGSPFQDGTRTCITQGDQAMFRIPLD